MKNNTLLPHHHILLWLTSFFAMLTLSQATGMVVASVSFIAFFIMVFIRYKGFVFNTFIRLASFVVLVVFVLILSGGLTADAGTGFLSCLIVTKLPHLKERKDANLLVFFNILTPFIAFLQFQTPLIFFLGIISVFLAMSSAKSLAENVAGNKLNSFAIASKTVFSTLFQSILLLPLVFMLYIMAPRLDSPLWASYVSTQRTGVGDEMNVSQWTRLLNDTSTAFRVSFHDIAPPNNQMYFRGHVLWTFDGDSWKQTPSFHQINSNKNYYPVSSGKNIYNYSISYESIRSNKLFALDYPIGNNVNITTRNDGTSIFSSPRSTVKEINWQSAKVEFTPLDEDERLSALQLPQGSNPKLTQWSKEKRAEFETDEEFVNFIMNYFTTGFEYSTSPPRLSKNNSMDSFFFDVKSGFCPHYSSAFAIIMRAVGIPTRIVNGYIGHESVMVGGYYRIRQADAHAWNEVWINDEWVRLDPTHQVSTIRTRNDFAWNILSMTHDMVDLFKISWNDLFFNFNQQSQKKLIEDVKNWAMSISIKNNVIFGVSFLILITFALFFTRGRFFITRKSFAKKVNDILDSWDNFDDGDSWQVKTEFILPLLNDDDKVLFTKRINEARDIIYNPNSTLSITQFGIIIKDLKKMKKNKNGVK